MTSPPRFFRWLLGRLAPSDMRDGVLGDVDELFARRAGEVGARWWYRLEVVRSALPLVAVRVRRAAGRGREGRDHDRREGRMMKVTQDVRYALKALRSGPGLVAGVVASLALGIGATTVTYGVVDGVILHPYDFPDGDRLVAVGTQYPKLGATRLGFFEHIAPPEFVDIRDRVTGLEHVVAWDMGNRGVTFGDVTSNLLTGFWWGDGFPALGVEPIRGRGMTLEETLRGDPVAVLSHRVWQTGFGGDPSLVGGTILMNGNPYTVVGIMPPGESLYGLDLWIPMGADPLEFPRSRKQWQVIGRLTEGATLESVNRELEALARRTEAEYGAEFEAYEGWRLEARPLANAVTGQLRTAGVMLMGAIGFVLLLLCSNVASLLLARATRRRREVAIRTALGAGRGRIFSQLVTESLILAALGGALGVAFAHFGLRAIGNLVEVIPFLAGSVDLNPRVLLFTAGVSLFAGLLFGVVPALEAVKGDVQGALRSESGTATMTRGKLRLQKLLVGVQVALAVLLLSGGGLFVHSLLKLTAVDPGFDPEGVLTMRMTLPREEYDMEAVAAFFEEVERRVSGIPGVTASGVANQFPPVGFSRSTFQSEERRFTSEGEMPVVLLTRASPDYFDALGVDVLSGRTFTRLDRGDGAPVAVLNEEAARLLFPDGGAVGGRIRPSEDGGWARVVGVVANTSNAGLDAPPEPEVYVSVHQLLGGWNQLFLLVRTVDDPRAVLPAVRRGISALDPDQPVYAIRTMEEAFAQGMVQRWVAATTLAVFASFALLLAGLGIYGVVAFSVGRRTREIGLRMALGASGGRVRRLVVWQAVVPVLLGSVAGLGGALLLGGTLEELLFELSGTDPLTLVTVTALFLSVSAAAALLPAMRASRLDPAKTLREE